MLTILAGPEADASSTSGNAIITIAFYAVIIGGLFYFLMIRPQRTRMRKHQELVSTIDIGDEVTTIGGIYGTIEMIDDHVAILQTEGGGRLKVSRRALADRVGGHE